MTTAKARRRREREQIGLLWVVLVLLLALGGYQLLFANPKNADTATAAKDAAKSAERTALAVQGAASANRRTLCGVADLLLSQPVVRIPGLITDQQWNRILHSRNRFLGLAHGIDCKTVLADAKGGGQQSSPNTGPQLPGGAVARGRAPDHSLSPRIRLPARHSHPVIAAFAP